MECLMSIRESTRPLAPRSVGSASIVAALLFASALLIHYVAEFDGGSVAANPGRPSATLPRGLEAPSRMPEGLGRAQLNAAYGKLPLSFEENQGQTDSRVKFIARGSGYTLFLTATEAVLQTESLW